MEPFPDAGALPAHEPSPTGTAGAAAHFLWQQAPRDAAPQDEENAREHSAIGKRLPPRISSMPGPALR